MVFKKFIENITCIFTIIFSVTQLIYSIFYIIDLAKLQGNNLLGPIINALLLLAFLIVGLICINSPNRKPLFIVLLAINIILYIYSIILNISGLSEYLRMVNQLPLATSMTVSRILNFINLPLTFILVLSIFSINADRFIEEK